jgi:hypothetical protein
VKRKLLLHWQAFVVWFTRLYIHYFVGIDRKSKCPACGTRKRHKIKFNPVYMALLHQCAFCEAVWGEPSLINASQWAVKPVLSDPQQPATESKPQGAQREPMSKPMRVVGSR